MDVLVTLLTNEIVWAGIAGVVGSIFGAKVKQNQIHKDPHNDYDKHVHK